MFRAEPAVSFRPRMIRGVEPHVARSLWRLYGFDHLILIGRILMNDREGDIRIRGKRIACSRV
jgi:hypothetical protein